MDLQRRGMDRLSAGETSHAAAAALQVAALQVTASRAIKWAARQRATGRVTPGQMGGHRLPKIADADRDRLLAGAERTPHVTVATLTAGLEAHGLKVRPASIGRYQTWPRSGGGMIATSASSRTSRMDPGRR